jgi:D-serine deaminase-like pyridoxal phosphate-dependent protein
MNQERGFVGISQTGRTFAIGDRLRVIPNHVCPVVNLHDQVGGVRCDKVEEVWRVAARGKLQQLRCV